VRRRRRRRKVYSRLRFRGRELACTPL